MRGPKKDFEVDIQHRLLLQSFIVHKIKCVVCASIIEFGSNIIIKSDFKSGVQLYLETLKIVKFIILQTDMPQLH